MNKLLPYFLVLGLATYLVGPYLLASSFFGEVFLGPGEGENWNMLSSVGAIFVLSFLFLIVVVFQLSGKRMKNFLESIHKEKKVKRKKILGVKEKKFRISVDNMIYILAFVGPLFSLPQFFDIFVTGDANRAALFSWGSYLVLGGAWFVYGIVHRYKPLIIAYAIWILLEIAIIGKIALG